MIRNIFMNVVAFVAIIVATFWPLGVLYLIYLGLKELL